MTSAAVTPIFWGTSWSAGNATVQGLGQFYGGIGGSHYLNTNTEYTGTNGQVGTAVSVGGPIIDNSAAPRRAPLTGDIAAEVAKLIPTPVANGYYPVYTDLPRGHAGYCAWHSWATDQRRADAVRVLLQARRRSGLRPERHADRSQRGTGGACERQRPRAERGAHRPARRRLARQLRRRERRQVRVDFSGTPENLGGTAGRSRAISATPRPRPTAATTARAASTASDRHSMGRGRDPASPHRSPGAVSRSSRKCSSMTAQFSIGWNGSSLTCERSARIVPPCETTSRRSPG